MTFRVSPPRLDRLAGYGWRARFHGLACLMALCTASAQTAATTGIPPSASPVSDSASPIQITDHYDSGITPPFSIDGNVITFDFSGITFPYIDCELQGPPQAVTVRLRLNARGALFYGPQGLYVSADGETFTLQPLTKVGETTRTVAANGKAEKVIYTDFEAVVAIGPSGRVRLSCSDPYGRDHLDKLLCDTANNPVGRWRFLRKHNRSLVLFELGEDDGRKPIHHIIAGEDNRETECQWTADHMIRKLCADPELARELGERAVIRICPMLSPYTSSTRGHNSYTSETTGKDMYGAAKWGADPLPAELDILHGLLQEALARRQLGFVLTMHSWWAGKPVTEIETIRSAGANRLSPARAAWAQATMQTFMEGVPHAHVTLPERIWYPGILREVMLARHNVVTFRVEITTLNQPTFRGETTAGRFLKDLARLDNWRPVWDPAAE